MQDWERDYGLARGERFEPVDLDEEFDPSRPHVPTVLGPIDPGALGMTVFCRSLEHVAPGGGDDPGSILGELETAHYLGLRGLAVTGKVTSDDGQALLRWIAQRSPVHIVQVELTRLNATIWWDEWADQASEPEFVIVDDLADLEPVSLKTIALRETPRILAGLPQASSTASPSSLTDLLHAAPLVLMNAGRSAMDVRQILVDNPASLLTRSSDPSDERRNER